MSHLLLRDPSTLGDSGWTVRSKSEALREALLPSGTGVYCSAAELLAVCTTRVLGL